MQYHAIPIKSGTLALVVPYYISLSCLMNGFAYHLLHVSFDGKALTEDSDLQQELQLGAEAWRIC